jgi:cell division protein YceG involved in septum cleavage
LASIKAVVEADPNIDYWYYLSDKTGKTHYSKTLEEHNRNIEKYLQ